MSSTPGRLVPGRVTRKQVQAQNSIGYWVGKVAEADTGTEALNQAWSWTLGAIRARAARYPDKAEAARYHLARQLALFAVQLPEAEIELRTGLTAAEVNTLLLDPWGRQQEAGQ